MGSQCDVPMIIPYFSVVSLASLTKWKGTVHSCMAGHSVLARSLIINSKILEYVLIPISPARLSDHNFCALWHESQSSSFRNMPRYGTDGPCTCWGEWFHRTESFFLEWHQPTKSRGIFPCSLIVPIFRMLRLVYPIRLSEVFSCYHGNVWDVW